MLLYWQFQCGSTGNIWEDCVKAQAVAHGYKTVQKFSVTHGEVSISVCLGRDLVQTFASR